jgi:heat-inducible transcriptional repressor
MLDTSTVVLTHRQAQVLQATVRRYITTAEPVGSKALSHDCDLSVSAATIRNTMGALERAGFLYQPHTSAGRVPSDSGYRAYVDQLLVPVGVFPLELTHRLSHQLNWEAWSLEAVLRRAAQILSGISGYITLITLPQTATARLRHLQLVALGSGQVMLIVVTTTYETRSIVFPWPTLPSAQDDRPDNWEEELQVVSNFLNAKLHGKLLQSLSTLDWQELGQELQGYADGLQQQLQQHLAALNHHLLQSSAPSQILISGMAELLRQPEFSELQQVQALLQLLEENQDQLWSVMFEVAGSPEEAQGVKISIGAENPLEPMRVCSLVSAVYCREGQPAGRVALVGPTRMAYEQAIAAVEATANYLSAALT